nr:Dynein heavy chain 6; axonemal [Biomphalaria glabrata]
MFRFLCQILVFCYLWALGGNLNDECRDAFDLFIRQQFDENQDAKLPGTYPLWSYYIEVDSKRMDLWERLVSSFRFDKSISFFKMMVPTVDTARYGYFLERLLSVQKPVLFTGGTGVGKAIINGFLLDFSRNARTLAEPIVNSAVELYFRMSSDLLPTPAKSHYVFNLRDLSKVVQGILQADAGIFREKNSNCSSIYSRDSKSVP